MRHFQLNREQYLESVSVHCILYSSSMIHCHRGDRSSNGLADFVQLVLAQNYTINTLNIIDVFHARRANSLTWLSRNCRLMCFEIYVHVVVSSAIDFRISHGWNAIGSTSSPQPHRVHFMQSPISSQQQVKSTKKKRRIGTQAGMCGSPHCIKYRISFVACSRRPLAIQYIKCE